MAAAKCVHSTLRLQYWSLKPRSYTTIRDPNSRLPTIAQPTFWSSLIPGPLRRTAPSAPKSPLHIRFRTWLSKPWNPATVFIILPLFIGSQEIQLIALKGEVLNYTRNVDAHIAVLKEVIRRIQEGDTSVDVEKMLGTGDERSEEEWRGVIAELEKGGKEWGKRRNRRKGIGQTAEAKAEAAEQPEESTAKIQAQDPQSANGGKASTRKSAFF